MLADIEALAAGSMARLQKIEDALNALISPDPMRREFLAHERWVSTALLRYQIRCRGVGMHPSRSLPRHTG